MNSRKLDLIYGGTVVVAVLLVYWTSTQGARPPVPIANDPFWYPTILLVLIGGCAVVMSLQVILGQQVEAPAPVRWGKLAVAIGFSVFYLLTYERIGFVLDTLALIPLLGWFLGFRRPIILVIVSVGFTAAVWYSFDLLLHITPPGLGLPTF
ncbi:tripartite tricarboxylate transporter TctB family protein [Salinisphaera aquimarina]|uniref:Tripartite tricarboxylate transporter TctB family protein n=1 Tax=Salinisphaera aquimarina TaxID=2094031 RepID=A0ABV7ETR1_9GAMM